MRTGAGICSWTPRRRRSKATNAGGPPALFSRHGCQGNQARFASSHLFVRLLLLLASALLVGAPLVQAAESVTFTTTLPADVQAAAGLPKLTVEQRQELDRLIQRDLDAARQGAVVAFAKTFSERRTEEEKQKSGLDALADGERAQLDAAVASAIANRAASSQEIVWTPTSARILRERQQPIIHGEVSMFYGQGRGDHSWYGGSFATTVTDPSRRMTLGIGYAEIREKGAPDHYRRLRRAGAIKD